MSSIKTHEPENSKDVRNKSKMNKIKLLIVGCGSIGRRHARNAKELGAEVVLCDINKALMMNITDELSDIPCYSNYLEAGDQAGVNTAVIATPSSTHVEIAINLAKKGIHLLVEKPLSNSLKDTAVLLQIVRERGLTAMMAQSYRFHEGFIKLKDLLINNTIGTIYHVSYHTGWYLPDWHVHEDYRVEYSARRSLGGGVTLTNFSHSFDTLQWLFGEIDGIIGWKAKKSSLEIDVEDCAFCILHTKRGVVITNTSDFLCRLPRNEMKIIGSTGFIEADFSNAQHKVWRIEDKRFPPGDLRMADIPGRLRILEDGVQYDPEPDVVPYNFAGNNRYLAEMKYFFERVEAGDVEFDLDLRSGLRVLELIMDPCFRNMDVPSASPVA